MQLKLEELQKVVKKVVNNEKRVDALKEELTRVIGPKCYTMHGVRLMAETANHQLDFMIHTGRNLKPSRTSVLVRFMDSDEPELRKLVARLLPESFVRRMVNDPDYSVRLAVAERLPADQVKKMIRKGRGEDQIRTIYNRKKLQEAGLPNPSVSDEEFDINGEKPLGDTAQTDKHPGLTDQWYDLQARNLTKSFGGNLEGRWEEDAVKVYCNGMKSQGVEVDHDKLLDAVYDLLAKRDENVMEESSLRSLARRLRSEDNMSSAVMPILDESRDPVDVLVESGLSSSEYIKRFDDLFGVIKGPVSNPGRSQGINENFSRVVVPMHARLPAGGLRSSDERAFDVYVKNWNTQREIRNQPYRLSWHPTRGNRVAFQLELA